ncbi:retrovirus-related pol polyprotein from transposon TNT 1-94 [Tanacetum coccineum]
MSKVLQEKGFRSLPSSTETNLRDHVKLISTNIEVDTSLICRIRSPQYAISTGQNSTLMHDARQTTILFLSRLNDYYCEEKKGSYGSQFSEAYSYGASHIDKSIPKKEKDPWSFTLPYFTNNVCFDNALDDLGASVSVMPLSTYLNLRLCELAHTKLTIELADRTVKYPKGIVENVLVRVGKFVFLVNFIILDMPEDIKVPLILERPFLSTARAKIDRVYMLSLRERMELYLEARLIGETLVLNRSLDPLFRDYIELNDLNVPIELRRDHVNDLMATIEEGEVIEEFRARNDSRMVNKIYRYPSDFDPDKKIHFAVLEDMDDYRDEGMGDVIFGEPFLREVGINARRFDGMITIYNGDNEVSEDDKKNGISHPYQKLKGFYKGVLNLGPEFIRDPTMKEWLTRGHVSMYEME